MDYQFWNSISGFSLNQLLNYSELVPKLSNQTANPIDAASEVVLGDLKGLICSFLENQGFLPGFAED